MKWYLATNYYGESDIFEFKSAEILIEFIGRAIKQGAIKVWAGDVLKPLILFESTFTFSVADIVAYIDVQQ